jgi:hypothetical protein
MAHGQLTCQYFTASAGHLAWSAIVYHHERQGTTDRFDRVMKILNSVWADLMRNLAGGVLAFAVGWIAVLEGASNLALHWRVTLTAAIGFAMGFIGAFYSDMLLDLIHYYGDF